MIKPYNLSLYIMSVLIVTSLQAQEISEGLSLPEYQAPPLESFSSMVERPLFTVTRRPDNVIGSGLDDLLINKNVMITNFRLSGVIYDGTEYVALIKSSENGDAQKLTKGQSIEGWTLEDIKSEEVWLSSGANISVISLRDNKLTQVKQRELLQKARVMKLIKQQKQKMLDAQKKRNN